MIYTPYVIPLLVGAAILIWMAVYALRFKEVPTARIFSLLSGLMAFWALNQALEISTSWLDLKIFLIELRAAVNVFIPPVSLILALTYTGRSQWRSRKNLGLLLSVPLVIALLSMTSTLHKFFRYDYRLDLTGPFPILLKTYAFGYGIFLIYTFVMLIITSGILFAALRNPKLDFRNTLVLIASLFIPFIAEMIDNLGFIPIRGYSLTPATFVLPALLYGWAMLRNRLFSVAPLAYRIAIQSIADVVIVLDNDEHIVDFNPAARAACGLSESSIGSGTDSLSSLWAELFQRCRLFTSHREEISLGKGNEQRIYDLSISPILDTQNHQAGRLFLLRDLTERKRAEEALRQSEMRYRLMSENAPLASVVTDLETGKLVYANQRAVDIFGVPLEQAVGSNASVYYADPGERQHYLQLLRDQGQVTDFEMHVKGRDGQPFWVSMSSNISSFNGRPAIHTTFTDISERKRAEEDLRTSEARFRTLFEQAAVGVALTETNTGRYVRVNQKLCNMLGYTMDEMLHLRYQDVTHPEDLQTNLDNNALLMAGEVREFSVEKRYLHKDGQSVWIILSVAPLWLPGSMPDVYYHIGVIQDITQRKQAEEAQRDSEQRYRSLFDRMADGVYRSTPQGRFVSVNPAMVQMFGYANEEEMLALDIKKELYFSPEERENVLMDSGDLKIDIYRMRRKDGSEIWVEDHAQYVLDEQGKVLFHEGILRDISERKRIEEELRETHDYLENLLSYANAPIIVWDTEYKITHFNHAFERITGCQSQDVIGRNLDFLFPVHSRQQSLEFIERASQGERWETVEIPIQHVDGSVFILLWNSATIYTSDGSKAIATIAQGQDITKRKQAEEELRQINAELEQQTDFARQMASEAEKANLAKSAFLANMSHEIRTPMNGVIGMTGLLLDTNLDEEQRNYAGMIRSSGESLLALINDILDLSKIESGKLDLEMLDFDLYTLLDHLAETMAFRAHEKGLVMQYTAAADVPSRLQGDVSRLRQILTNLLGNAVKFTQQGGITILVTKLAEKEGQVKLRFAVRDTGIGIPVDKVGLLFNKFTQVDASVSRQYGGTGLGLAISKQLVELMGGEIGLLSEEGKGSEFWFNVSLKTQPERRAHIPRKNASEIKLISIKPDKHILLVEDNLINQKVALGILKKLGLRADAAGNGLEALRALETQPYGLVLMDVQMPEMDGLEATRQIRDIESKVLDHEIPIIAMTANAMLEDRERCLQSGMNDFITKPVQAEVLAQVLARWLPKKEGEINPAS